MRNNLIFVILLLAGASLGAWLQRPQPPAARPTPSPLQPVEGRQAPALHTTIGAVFETTQGPLTIDIYPEAAPKAAARFQELIQARFYDGTPIFRVEPGFVAQFGINSKMAEWKNKQFDDDPACYRLTTGTLGFAKAGPNTNSTQVFISYGDNSQLSQQAFTAFARIREGYPNTLKFKQVPQAGDQEALWNDTPGFLKTLPNQPDRILTARLL
jgi:cyclophilin family peptidyl-prolyl cis-trans isomerase